MNRSVLAAAILAPLASCPAVADDLIISLKLEKGVFAPSEIAAPTGQPFIIKFENAEDQAVELECKPCHVEKVATARSTILARVAAMKPGSYLFVDEYREETVKGQIVVK